MGILHRCRNLIAFVVKKITEVLIEVPMLEIIIVETIIEVPIEPITAEIVPEEILCLMQQKKSNLPSMVVSLKL